MGKAITVVMVDGVADWKIGPILPCAREWFGDTVRIAGIDGQPPTSIGCVRIQPECALADLSPLEGELWLLPGSERGQDGEIPARSAALRACIAAGVAMQRSGARRWLSPTPACWFAARIPPAIRWTSSRRTRRPTTAPRTTRTGSP